MYQNIFTSESVTAGHPDKICDSVSDAILDAALSQDPESRVAIDTWVKGNALGVIGEIKTNAKLDFEATAREKVNQIGYFRPELGFTGDGLEFFSRISAQSGEISKAVDKSNGPTGAGDQGLMFGYACDQTESLMPLPIVLAHSLAKKLHIYRKSLELRQEYLLGPDGKTQATLEFNEDWKPVKIGTILISTQHNIDISQVELQKLLIQNVILPVIQDLKIEHLYQEPNLLINPSGSFVEGGPVADSGLTGRKIIVDSYGGWARVGGGAFSGKDATKVDRSAAYMARFLAKNVVSKGWANETEIQLSYAIGRAEPVSIGITGKLNKNKDEILQYITHNFDLTPAGIINFLELNKPIFSQTSAYGHFGQVYDIDDGFSWEKLV
jgi:S-adenosylmethionine synthetase